MAKSMRSKREKRLRAIRREIVEPFYDKKDAAKLAAQEAALGAPKLAAKPSSDAKSSMEFLPTSTTTTSNTNMDVEMEDCNGNMTFLKPSGGVGKKFKKEFKVGKRRRHGKGKGKGRVRRRHI